MTTAELETERAKDRARYKEKRAGQWVRWERQALKHSRERAARKGLEFSLLKGDLVCPSHCPILGIPLVVGDPGKRHSPSLDRFDNSKGYTKDNVWVISNRANNIKSDATLEELERVVAALKARNYV